jgi:hypothetical protein
LKSRSDQAARRLFKDLLQDGERSSDEVEKLAAQYAYLAFDGAAAEVQVRIPGFDLQWVEAEAARHSLETFESLATSRDQAEIQKEKAIANLQSAREQAKDDEWEVEEQLHSDPACDKAKSASSENQNVAQGDELGLNNMSATTQTGV